MFQFSNVETLTLFTAATCNLNCSYCYLHKNNSYHTMEKELVEAWKTGEYVKNCVKVFNRLGADKKQVKRLELWGGETLLHVDLIKQNIKDIFREFPNISTMSLSTNFMIDIDKTIELFKEINTYTNKKMHMYFQTSIDGNDPELMSTGHTGNWEIYKKNFEKLAFFFNNNRLANFKSITVAVKPTIDKDVFLRYFSDIEKMEEYMDYMHETYTYLKNTFINSMIRVGVEFPSPALPLNTYTVEDGQTYADICRKWDSLKIRKWQSFKEEKDNKMILYNIYSVNENLYKERSLNPGSTMGCFKQITDFTICPDGTLTDCTSDYILDRDDYYQECLESGNENDARIAKVYKKINFNPLKMTNEELTEVIWHVCSGIHYAINTQLNMTMGLIDELALSGQIPWKYHSDKMLQYKAATFCNSYSMCIRTNVWDTGTTAIRSFGAIRYFLNGLFDIISEDNSRFNHTVLGSLTYEENS